MRLVTIIAELPQVPAVYAMYGGDGLARHVAYVGVGKELRSRVRQHLVLRDSSVTTGVSAASLNPDHVTEVCWWEHQEFGNRDYLEAAELVAFDVLNPALRSRGGIRGGARELYEQPGFCEELTAFFSAPATGCLSIRSLARAWEKIDELSEKIKEMEARLSSLG